MNALKIKLPKILEVVSSEEAKESIDSEDSLVLLIPLEDIEVEEINPSVRKEKEVKKWKKVKTE